MKHKALIHQALTSAQLGIWLGQAIKPQSAMYNAAEYLEFKGEFNQTAFIQAATFVLQNTSALNMAFVLESGEPIQKRASEHVVKNNNLIFVDLSKELAPYETAVQFLKGDLKNALDIQSGKNYRHILIKLAEDHYMWNLCIHHIASDGYSFSLLADTVLTQYKAVMNTGFLSDLSFGDYNQVLTEDIQYRQSKYFELDQNYWINFYQNIKNVRSICSTPSDINETHIKSTAHISLSTFQKLNDIGKAHKTSWTDVLLTLSASLIHQYTGIQDTVIGMPVASRMGSKSANVPCMQMNIVPVSLTFSQAKTLSQLLDQVSSQIKIGRRHFRARYEDLKQVLARNTQNKKLFGPVVNIIPFERQLYLHSCEVDVHTLSAGPVDDLAFTFIKQIDGSLKFDLYANPNNYNQKQIDTLSSHLIDLINEVNIELNHNLTVDINHLSYFSSEALPTNSFAYNCVIARIYRSAKLAPASIAIRQDAHKLSYCELIDIVSTIAANIWDLGLPKNQTIALVIPRSEQAITMMLATLLLGHRFVVIDPDAPLKRNLLILKDAKPSLVVLYPSIDGELRQATAEYFCIDTPALELSHMNVDVAHLWLVDENKEQQDAYLIYTSGSTGIPKGVVIGYSALNEFTLAGALDYEIDSSDTVLQFAPLHFDACIEEIFISLSVGAQLVLRNDEMLNSPAAFLKQCERWNISILDLPTAYWHEIALATQEQSLSLYKAIKTIIIGGEAVQVQRVEQWRKNFGTQVKLLNTYGPSEATVVATFTDLSQEVSSLFIGKPLRGRQVAVVDSDLNVLPKGESGELILLGAGLSKGYLGLPDKTAECFVQISLPRDTKTKVRAYRTGDRVKLHTCDNLEFLGRIDSQIKISGYRIELGEVENAILNLEGIEDVVVTVSSEQSVEQVYLIAHLVTKNDVWNEAKLRQSLTGILPLPMLPSRVILHEHLPKNAAGKIDRKALSLYEKERIQLKDFKNVLTEFEKSVAGIWQAVLGIDNISADDDFFIIGGQSLQSIQVANRLSNLFKREIPVSLIFSYPRLRDLSQVLESNETQHSSDKENTFNLMQQDISHFSQNISKNINPSSSDIEVVLLTGATGFVGAQLLKQLLDTSNAQIKCIVRADNEIQGLKRLEKAFLAQGLKGFDTKRITALCLDLADPFLGFDEKAFLQLANLVDCVFHNAAQTSVMRDYQSLREANVLPTAHLLHLASVKGIPFNHVSTIAVAQASDERLAETYVPIHDALKDGYQQSKWVSESLVEAAHKQGYPVNIYRLARVTGDLNSGYINSKDLVWSIIRAGLNNKVLPDIQVQEPWTPVDFVAQFMVTHGMQFPGEGVFNLTPKHKVKVAEIFAWLKLLSFDFSLIDLNTWCKEIKENGSDQDHTILSFFEQMQADTQGENNIHITQCINDKFLEKAEKLAISLPKIDRSTFCLYLEYALKHKLISPPEYDFKKVSADFLKQDKQSQTAQLQLEAC
ncbi:non-ribosomal peptide synthetase [Pseudoalteromonas denitrificans]|uniref:Nonribosomal peptide synthetase MxcG n=1 Tax=Pseudoalteromonas denitrificans DSM 6059 TaxID=1123010 RepID=A0A1I1EJW1_9GAMM|nr:non-ribosomal peptide synthetase [Pseudoalteromonas denitrificans]SFB87385.1 nonribosomal peptide synthetase MxcG [Pseudoalteromonas denitrificans DSM 6059]